MSSPEKKKKKTATKKPLLKPSPVILTPNSSLPDDLLLSCFARASTLYYPTLSLVSKSFRSLLTSPLIYQTRSLLGRTNSCLYVCLRFNPDSDPRWFTLCLKPNQFLTNNTEKKSSGYALAPIPVPHSPQAYSERVAAVVGSDIYFIGGPINDSPSSSVSILDCKSHTWREAPSMLVKRSFATATVFNGKIYVSGGCRDFNIWIYMEVFDPNTQTWEACGDPPNRREKQLFIHKNVEIEEAIVMLRRGSVVYYLNDNIWETVEWNNNSELGWAGMSSCTIDSVLYTYSMITKIKWYDYVGRNWKDVMGLESLPTLVIAGDAAVRLVDYGGKMVVLWDKFLPSKEKTIRCAVIALALERRKNSLEIWGNIEWFGDVLTVPESYGFVCALTATV